MIQIQSLGPHTKASDSEYKTRAWTLQLAKLALVLLKQVTLDHIAEALLCWEAQHGVAGGRARLLELEILNLNLDLLTV